MLQIIKKDIYLDKSNGYIIFHQMICKKGMLQIIKINIMPIPDTLYISKDLL